MECLVCCNSFTKTSRRWIPCNYCSYHVCSLCIRTYLLDSIHKPHCMNCRREWSQTFLMTHFYYFMTSEYRAKRELLLFEKQKALIPTILPMAERDKKIELYQHYLTRTQQELITLYNPSKMSTLSIEDWKREKRDIKKTIRALITDRHYILINEQIPERKSFIMRCTMEDCRGYLTVKYKCGLCSVEICSHCHCKIESNHVCNPDTVATIIELKKSTKPCPSCHTLIYKSEGCDQMWCIQCHTAFSWKSGQIEQGIIHNPHYFDYLKEKGELPRNALDVPCGGLPHFRRLYDFYISQSYSMDEINYIRMMYESLVHFREWTLQHDLPNPQVQLSHNDLLISYVLNKISEKQLKASLYVRENKRERGLEERQILEAYVTIGEESFRKLIQQAITMEEFIHEIEHIKWYSHNELKQLDLRYEHTGFLQPDVLIH